VHAKLTRLQQETYKEVVKMLRQWVRLKHIRGIELLCNRSSAPAGLTGSQEKSREPVAAFPRLVVVALMDV
jgi:hypothetical protein